MSGIYSGNEFDLGGSLYETKTGTRADSTGGTSDASTAGAAGASENLPALVSPVDAVSAAVNLVANPAGLLSDVFPADPAQSKLPLGWAIVGACAVAVIFASWVEGKIKE